MTIQWSHYIMGETLERNKDLEIGRRKGRFEKRQEIFVSISRSIRMIVFLSDEIHCFSAKFMMFTCCDIWQVLSWYCG